MVYQYYIEFVSLGDAPVSINSIKTSSLAIDDEISVADSQMKNSFTLDSVDIMDDEYDVNETEYTTYTFTYLLPNTMYNFYSVRSEQAENFFSVENLLYISQGISDDTGTLSFTYIPMFDDIDSVKLAVPISKNIALASVTIPEMTYAGESLNVKPVVKLNGITLSEGTDYKLEGDTEISDSGYYVLDVVEIGEYEGYKSISYTVESENSVILGDVDGDGQITAMDASAVLTYYVMNPESIEDLGFPFNIKAADWDGNGLINAIDASAILTYYVSH